MTDPNYIMNCTCTRVVDGDTAVFDVSPGFNILMQGLIFRFNGINAPELKSKVKSTAALALKAKQFVIAAILGKDVQVQFTKNHGDQEKIDKYGRYLAVVWYVPATGGEKINLNLQMIALGLAKEYIL